MTSSSRSIRICLFSLGSYALFHPDEDVAFGGSEVQMYFLATHLASDPSFDVHMIVGDHGQAQDEMQQGVSLHRGPRAVSRSNIKLLRKFPRSTIQLYRLMRDIDADVYVQRTASAMTGIMCALSHVMRKTFVYMTAHDIDCNGEYERRVGYLHGMRFRYGLRHADLVITQSLRHQAMISAYHKKESVVLHSMYPIPDDSLIRPEEKKYSLWVGRCESWKRPEVVLELARKFPAEAFMMVCAEAQHEADFFEQIRSQAQALPNVTFIPYVSFAHIAQYFREAKVFLQTSVNEGFPNTFIQAAMNKTPILSLTVNPDDFLEKSGSGCCAHSDKQVFFDYYMDIVSKPEKRIVLGTRGYQYVQKEYNVATIIPRYKELFRHLILKDI